MNVEPLSRGLETLVARYGAIVVGLAIGTAAKYGLQLSDGKRLTLRGLVIDALLLGMLSLIAIVVADQFNLQGNLRVGCGALAAVSGDRLIRLVRDRFLKDVEGQMSRLLPPNQREAVMHVPAGKGEPDAIGVANPATTSEGRISANLKRAYGRSGSRPVPEDQIEQLRRLDD